MQKTLRHKASRRLLVRYGLILANVLVLAAVAVFVFNGSKSGHLTASVASLADESTANPVDGLTAYDIAASVAQLADLPESTPINSQAQSARVTVAVSTSDTSMIVKPQLVVTDLKSKDDIVKYIVQPGDTVTSIAQQFGITTDSVKWSNNLQTDNVSQGSTLVIPPVNGIVYTVKAGDTVQSLATKYKSNADQIIASNDAEIKGIATGQQILIPGGQILAPVSLYSGLRTSFSAAYGYNGYDYGYCTWYVANKVSMPSNWGNANTWAYYAALSGWAVSATPRPGAIAQTSAGRFGHVAYVEAVSDDGSMIKYSDMNGLSGWGRVGYSDWTPSSHFQHYIYH